MKTRFLVFYLLKSGQTYGVNIEIQEFNTKSQRPDLIYPTEAKDSPEGRRNPIFVASEQGLDASA